MSKTESPIKKILLKPLQLLQHIFRLCGFNLILIRTPKNPDGLILENECYDEILPNSTYAPWLADREFKEIYNKIKDFSLVDKYRCFELWQLVAESKKVNGALLEIGVWRGGTGSLIAKKAELEGINDTIYLCDTFTGVVKAGEYDSYYSGSEHSDTSKSMVEELVYKKLKLSNVVILQGVFPDETKNEINDSRFRFCHIDVDVYQSAKDIVEWIWPKLSINGIIVYDDYGFFGCTGITKFVNEERKKTDRLVIHNLNGHAIIIKISQ